MKYKIKILKKALKFITKQNPEQRQKIFDAIYNLPKGDTKLLQAQEGRFRLRVGNYRIIYEQNKEILFITVIDAENRGQIYKRY